MTAIALALLRLYKWLLSPLLPASCRFTPTCSEYAAEAIAVHGTLKGTALAMWRLLRCHPFSHGDFDPVPLRKTDHRHPERARTRESKDPCSACSITAAHTLTGPQPLEPRA